MKLPSGQNMEDTFAPLRAATASAELHTRVARLALESRPKTRPRLALTLAAGFSLALLAGIALIPGSAGAASLIERMARAVDGAKSLHARTYTVVKDKWVETGESWYADGNWRIADSYHTTVFGNGKRWSYTAGNDLALESVRNPGEMPEGLEGAFRLKATFAAMNAKGFHFQLTYGKERLEGNREVIPVIVSRTNHETERQTFVVEKGTDLPLSGESQVLTPTGWKAQLKWECEYNVPVDASEFSGSFGPKTRVLDRSAFAQELTKKLSKPIVSAKMGGQTVSIRDVFVNSKGWVFLLWTGDIGGQDHRLFLTDSDGNAYARGNFNPGEIPYKETQAKLVTVDGSVVDGAWFIPVGDLKPKSRSQRLVVMSTPVVRGDRTKSAVAQVMLRRPYEPDMVPIQDGVSVDPVLQRIGELTIPAVTAAPSLLPAYVPLFDNAPQTNAFAERSACDARKHYWMVRLNSVRRARSLDRALVPPISMDGEPMDGPTQLLLPGATLPPGSNLAVLKKLEQVEKEYVAAEARSTLDGEASGLEWFELSALQRALGLTKDADQSVANAERVRPEIRWR